MLSSSTIFLQVYCVQYTCSAYCTAGLRTHRLPVKRCWVTNVVLVVTLSDDSAQKCSDFAPLFWAAVPFVDLYCKTFLFNMPLLHRLFLLVVVAGVWVRTIWGDVVEYNFNTFPKNIVALHMPCEESNVFATKCMCHIQCTDPTCSNARALCSKYETR